MKHFVFLLVATIIALVAADAGTPFNVPFTFNLNGTIVKSQSTQPQFAVIGNEATVTVTKPSTIGVVVCVSRGVLIPDSSQWANGCDFYFNFKDVSTPTPPPHAPVAAPTNTTPPVAPHAAPSNTTPPVAPHAAPSNTTPPVAPHAAPSNTTPPVEPPHAAPTNTTPPVNPPVAPPTNTTPPVNPPVAPPTNTTPPVEPPTNTTPPVEPKAFGFDNFFAEANTTIQSRTFSMFFPGATYYVQAMLINPADHNMHTVTVNFAGYDCGVGQVADKTQCFTPIQPTQGKASNVTQTTPVQYFSLSIPASTGGLQVVWYLEGEQPTPPAPHAAPHAAPTNTTPHAEPHAAPTNTTPHAAPHAAPSNTTPPVEPPHAAPTNTTPPSNTTPTAAPKAALFFDSKKNDMIEIFGRLNANPSLNKTTDDFYHYGTSASIDGGIPALLAPGAGTWFFAVKNLNVTITRKYTIQFNYKQCLSNATGLTCNTPVVSLAANGTAQVGSVPTAGGLVWFKANKPATARTLYISLANIKGTAGVVKFTLFIQKGNAPSTTSYLFKGCSYGPCTTVSVAKLELPVGDDGSDYYVGIVGTNTTEQYALWADTACSNACKGHGTCEATATNAAYGTCVCTGGYTLLDCSGEPQGWPIQVIVLIIIGGLLLLTALIGLIAWIVSRKKKREGYESVA